MRSASICVLPDPAPASSRMFVSSSSWMSRRDSWSMARELDMRCELPIGCKFGIRQFFSSLPVHLSATSRDVVAESAIALIRCPDELSLDDQVAQVSKHLCDVILLRRLDPDALQLPLVAREVVDAGNDLWVLVTGLEQCDGGESIQRVLETTPSIERPLPLIPPEAASLIVEHLERSLTDLVNSINATSYPEGDAGA